jgi:NAD(P)-dependent dehydrogenase (short-subunit alcohol dehydrogenase family)
MKLADKVAVVTGAGSGIGRAVARAFHQEGARLVVADISGDEKVTAEALGDGAVAVRCDVSRSEDVAALMAAAVSAFGRIDVLCNNAGVSSAVARTGEFDEAEFDRVLSINLRSVFLGLRHALPVMVEGGGGSVVNVASTAGLVAYPGLSAYCAAKAGIIQLTRVAAIEYAADNIRVNALCPGNTDTPLARSFKGDVGVKAMGATPMGRLARPEEMASAAVFLAGPDSSFVTGAVLTADGGYTAM